MLISHKENVLVYPCHFPILWNMRNNETHFKVLQDVSYFPMSAMPACFSFAFVGNKVLWNWTPLRESSDSHLLSYLASTELGRPRHLGLTSDATTFWKRHGWDRHGCGSWLPIGSNVTELYVINKSWRATPFRLKKHLKLRIVLMRSQ